MSIAVLNPNADAQTSKAAPGRKVFLIVVGLLSALVLALIIVPMVQTLLQTYVVNGSLTLAPFVRAANMRGMSTIVWNTIYYTSATLLVATVFGVFLAWANERTDARINSIAGILPILPLTIPPIGSALGYVMLFNSRSGTGNLFLRNLFGLDGPTGPIEMVNFPGLVIVTALSLVPIVYLIVSAALQNIDPSLDEASRVSGASPFRTARKVTLPLVAPAIASAALLIGIHAVSSFTFPFIIGTGAGITTLSVFIYRMFSIYPTNPPVAVSVSMILLVIVYIGLFFQLKISRSLSRTVVGSKHANRSVVTLGIFKYPVRALIVGYLALVILPIIGLIIGSFQPYLGAPLAQFSLSNYETVLRDHHTRSALINSFKLGAIAAVSTIAIATILVFASARLMKRGGALVEYVLMFPSVIPHIVLAVAFIMTFGVPPFNLYGTSLLVLMAYCVMFMPEASRAASAAISQASEELSEASFISGAGFARTFRKVVLPQIRGGLLAGWSVVFFLAVNEVTASSFLAGLTNPVVGHLAIEYFSVGRMSEVAALTLIVTLITALVVAGVNRVVVRSNHV